MPYVNHNNVYTVEGNPVISRYIDLTKFISLLDKKSLFFTRVDKFEDPFEGTVPRPNYAARKAWYRHQEEIGFFKEIATDDEIEKSIKEYDASQFSLKTLTVVNCWHANESENALMWHAYASANAGIMIRSTFNNFCESIHGTIQEINISSVKYLDYNSDVMPDGNSNYPFIHKNKFYADEREIRAFFEVASPSSRFNWDEQETPYGLYVQCNLNSLINEIIVAPFAPDWYLNIVQSLNEKYELNKKITRSSLNNA